MARFEDNNRCCLCGKPKEEGRKIIVGLHGAVCSDCVSLCNDILLTGGDAPSPAARKTAAHGATPGAAHQRGDAE